MSFSIRQKQHDAVVQMLNLNPGRLGGGLSLNEHAPTEVYKVLIMDKHCFAIITPLVKVHELRRHGVTLHLLLENDRQPIPDVPALYFVSPTAENVQRITSDLKKNLYDAHYLNFSSSLPRKLLEDLAVKSTECGTSGKITKVFDQYLDFVSLAPTLFSLGRPDSYATLNDPSSSDQSVEGEVSQITQGLLAVCATLGKAPVIRCQKGGAAEAVARALVQTLRDHLKGKNGLFAGDASGATHDRPLLVLFDRAFDIPAAVKHDWKYAPLVHDILKMKLNRVDIGGDAGTCRGFPKFKQRLMPLFERTTRDVCARLPVLVTVTNTSQTHCYLRFMEYRLKVRYHYGTTQSLIHITKFTHARRLVP